MLYWRYHQYQVTGDQYAECGDGDLGHNPSAPPPPDPLAPTTPLVHLPIPPPETPPPVAAGLLPPAVSAGPRAGGGAGPAAPALSAVHHAGAVRLGQVAGALRGGWAHPAAVVTVVSAVGRTPLHSCPFSAALFWCFPFCFVLFIFQQRASFSVAARPGAPPRGQVRRRPVQHLWPPRPHRAGGVGRAAGSAAPAAAPARAYRAGV